MVNCGSPSLASLYNHQVKILCIIYVWMYGSTHLPNTYLIFTITRSAAMWYALGPYGSQFPYSNSPIKSYSYAHGAALLRIVLHPQQVALCHRFKCRIADVYDCNSVNSVTKLHHTYFFLSIKQNLIHILLGQSIICCNRLRQKKGVSWLDTESCNKTHKKWKEIRPLGLYGK